VVVDQPGVAVRITGDDGEPAHRIVYWETISELVVSPPANGTSDGERPTVRTVGLRMRRDPRGIVHRQVVDGWGYDRVGIEAAVERFAGDGVAVREEASPPTAPVVYEARLPPQLPNPPGVVLLGVLGVGAATELVSAGVPPRMLLAVLLVPALFLIAVRWNRRPPAVHVGEDGVTFGPGPGSLPAGGVHVRWPQVEAVVLFTVKGDRRRRPFVGVRTRPDPAGPLRITAHRLVDGRRLDQARLEAVVRAHRPYVPVVDLGRIRRRHLRH
jgi:hypothetical protein